MKRKLFILCGSTLAICGLFFAYDGGAKNFSELQIENIEALSVDEPNDPCHYVNGFSQSYLDPNPAVENSRRVQYRDCCYEEKVGYDPFGACI